MPVLNLPEQTFQWLVEQAAARNVSVEEVVVSAVAQLPAAETSTPEERLRAFERLTRRIESRADRYPPGHTIDDSRESIYAERENAQL
jgi:hypothetical protein